MTTQDDLLRGARELFGELKQAEEVLLTRIGAQKQEFISYVDPNLSFEQLVLINPHRIIRAKIISYLCEMHIKRSASISRGIFIHGALVTGKLNLAFMKLDIPVFFKDCLFDTDIVLDAAKLHSLSFEGSKTLSIQANAVHVEAGGVHLRNGFRAIGEVNFSRASINGDFDCISGNFLHPGKRAIVAAGMNVSGNVYMKNTDVEGEIIFTGFSVGGDFICSSSRFENRGNLTIQGDGAKIKGSLKLDDGFTSLGKISLTGAIIEGYADFMAANLINEGKEALSLDVAIISRDVALCHRFNAVGRVGLRGAKINGTLYLYEWVNREKVFLDLGFCSTGMLLDSEDSWPISGNLILNGFTYKFINELSPLEVDKRIQWIRSQSRKHYSFQPYEQLSQVYLDSGHENASIQVLVAKQKDYRSSDRRNTITKIRDLVLEYTISYGYKPLQVLKFTFFAILLGTLIFKIGYLQGIITPTDIAPFDPGQDNVSIDYPGFHPFIYSIDTFIPIIDFHQQAYWLPNSQKGVILNLNLVKIRSGDFLRYYLWFHIILGWTLTSLCVAGLTGVVKKQNP